MSSLAPSPNGESPEEPASEPSASEQQTEAERRESQLLRLHEKAAKAGIFAKPLRWVTKRALNRALERTWLEFARKDDQEENEGSRIPAGERVSMPSIWLVEVYTPTTLPGILNRMQRYMDAAKGLRRHEDLDSWVSAVRRRAGGAWIELTWVTRENPSYFAPDRRIDKIPDGVKYIRLALVSVTPSLTAIVAQFVLEDEHAALINDLVNTDRISTARRGPGSSVHLHTVEQQKAEAVDQMREGLRQDSEDWLRTRFPGFFAERPKGTYPEVELLFTEAMQPWDPSIRADRGNRWVDILGLTSFLGHWECDEVSALRMNDTQRLSGRGGAQRKHVMSLAARRKDLFEGDWFKSADDHSDWHAVQRLHHAVAMFATRYAISAVLEEIDGDLASIRDLTDKAFLKSSARSLDRLNSQLLRAGLDGRIVASEIKDLAANESAWRHYVPEFVEVDRKGQRKDLLADTLRANQQKQAERIIRAENSLGTLLETSANLGVAARNLRLQGAVMWLTVVSVVAAAVAAWAAVVAIQRPTPTPQGPPTSQTTSAVPGR